MTFRARSIAGSWRGRSHAPPLLAMVCAVALAAPGSHVITRHSSSTNGHRIAIAGDALASRDTGRRDAGLSPDQVVVYGIAHGPRDEAVSTARLHARQLLLLATGADVHAGEDGIKISSTNKVPGGKASVVSYFDGQCVVKLWAPLKRDLPTHDPSSSRAFRLTRTNALASVVQSIASDVEMVFSKAHGGRHPKSGHGGPAAGPPPSGPLPALAIRQGLRGRVTLMKMELLPQTNPPECRYDIEVRWEAP